MKSPHRIAYILPSLDAKAPVFLAKRIADYFISKGSAVEIFYFDEKQGTSFKCKTTRIKMNEPIDFDSFDIIHSHMMRPDKYVAKFSNRIRKAKTVSTIHCNIGDDLKYSYGSVVSAVYSKKWLGWLKSFDATVQINDYLMELYSKSLFKNHLIYNGISTSEQKDDYSDIVTAIAGFKDKGFFVLCSYSGIVKRKGLKQILRLLQLRKDLSYICIGEGKQKKELIDFAVKNKIADRIYFSPFKKNPYHVMNYADVFMIPSYSEGFSLALLEAGAVGASVVCSDIPAFTMPFSNTEVSFFKLDNITSLSCAVDNALKQKAEKAFSLKNKIFSRFSEEKMFLEYERLYRMLSEAE